jgi:hypothetical protein
MYASLVLSLALCGALLGCSAASGGGGKDKSSSGGTSNGSGGKLPPLNVGGLNTPSGSALSIAPESPTLDVSIVDGVVAPIAYPGGGTTLPFQAALDGSAVDAKWTLDRGELGSIDPATGTFSTSGKLSGIVKISASYGDLMTSTPVTIRIRSTQNGRGAAAPVAGIGGLGGVGGEGLGGPVDAATQARLRAGGTAPASPSDLSWLYPYDKTVWPHGINAPLLQWQTSRPASAVYIHLTQDNFEFEGFYSGTNLIRQPIDAGAWHSALGSNSGESLHVELTLADATGTFGPIQQDWLVAPGVLKGTVYYDSYSTSLSAKKPGTSVAAAVLAIKPGSNDPVLALPNSQEKCIVCHNVSDDGSTMFAVDAIEPGDDYSNGVAYDMKAGGSVIRRYEEPATDGTTNDRKFLYSALSKDGTFALQSSGNTQEAYMGVSRVFRRDSGLAETASGFDGMITQAVTPAFSRDGGMVAFNYWQGTLAPGGGNGHTLDIMDFVCGAIAPMSGAPSCSSYAFSNLRRLYTNPDTEHGFVGWPAWLPSSTGLVFHNTINRPGGGSPLATWNQAKAQIWYVNVPQGGEAPQAMPLRALNGVDAAGSSTLPKIPGHDDDYKMNYQPTVNPVPSGGYFWVVFTSRRAYGNVATGDPFDNGDGVRPIPKKLWVAAIDQNPVPGQDPSHPAFYLPGQELGAGNMRGFWVVDPCKADGVMCGSGDECCNGFCRPDSDSGALVCGGKPDGCAEEFEKCETTSDCCGATMGHSCINGFCARQVVK